ncbi:helix-turn-helix transcriptional regulator [Vannielia litorea]|uniref:helix-turn-helix transcriptional regulator n=1 Tax=Vannielia litorea TaxID=1217970 RepID=UPI001BCBE54A|nr:AlpA family phage regulatory protein [Vannielia litorea]MBS8225735.1 AlpA family phage regulatory protein [Vannielia litorea]
MPGLQDTPRPEIDRLISFSEALSRIGVSRSTAYRHIADGQMPQPVKIGALTFFSERELQTWIAEKLAARVMRGANV